MLEYFKAKIPNYVEPKEIRTRNDLNRVMRESAGEPTEKERQEKIKEELKTNGI